MAVDGVVVAVCEVVGVGLVDFKVMVLELDSTFGACVCLELGGVKEWTSGRVVSMVVVTSVVFFWGGRGGGGGVLGLVMCLW